MMLGRMGVAGEADGEASPFKQRKQIPEIGQSRVRLGVEIIAHRDVHDNHDEFVLRRLGQHVANEFKLRRVEPPLIFARHMRLGGVRSEIVDIVEHQEQRFGIVECVIIGAVDPLERLAAVTSIWRLEIEIVIAADIPPGNAYCADDGVVALIEREIVEHNVAGGEAEFRLRSVQGFDHVLADEIDFRVRFRLRVGEEDDFEFAGLVLSPQRKIERGGQWRGRREAFEFKAERSGRSPG